MIVYADVLIVVNTLVNFLILLLGGRLCGYPTKPWRCLCGGFAGGAYALFAAVSLNFSGFLWQGVVFVLMCVISYGLRRMAMRPSVLAFLMSAALAGFIQLAVQVFSIDALHIDGGVYFPIGAKILILLSGAFYLAAALLASGMLRHGSGEVYRITVSCPEGETEISALYDTGNTVKDPMGGQPVIIVDRAVAAKLFHCLNNDIVGNDPTESFSALQSRFPQTHFRLLPYKAVGVSCGLLTAFSCTVRVGHEKKIRKALAAISPTDVSDGSAYEALIGGELF